MKLYNNKNIPRGGIDNLTDYYAALVLGAGAAGIKGEHFNILEELGCMAETANSSIKFHDLDSETAHTFLKLAFQKIDGNKSNKRDVSNAKYLQSHYFTKDIPNHKKKLARAGRRIESYKEVPEKKVGYIAKVIKDKDFQKESVSHLKGLLNPSIPLKDRLKAVSKWTVESMKTHKIPKEERREETFNFYIAAWIAARDEIDDNTYHQLKTTVLLDLHSKGSEPEMIASKLFEALDAAEQISKWPRPKSR